MLQLQPIIIRIKKLLEQDTDASVTYAALEARLALEKVVYDRLRQRHDYISHEQLGKWQPGGVINTLISDVDTHAARGMTLSISKNPARPGVKLEDEEYVEVGTEVGFNTKKIVKLWNAVAKLALHVRLPNDKNDRIPDYGNRIEIRAKVEEVVAELERLSKATMSSSGFGKEVSFICSCGTKNKRRAELLKHGQHVYCINPKCNQTWKVIIDGDETNFENVTVEIPCRDCDVVNHVPWRIVTGMKYDELLKYPCVECGGANFVKWHLLQAATAKSISERGPKLQE